MNTTASLALVGLFAAGSVAASPLRVPFQGFATSAGGQPWSEPGVATIRFYSSPVAGQNLGEFTGIDVANEGGVVSGWVELTPELADALAAAPEVWLEVTLGSTQLAARQQVGSVFFALAARTAEFAAFADAAESAVVADVAKSAADAEKLGSIAASGYTTDSELDAAISPLSQTFVDAAGDTISGTLGFATAAGGSGYTLGNDAGTLRLALTPADAAAVSLAAFTAAGATFDGSLTAKGPVFGYGNASGAASFTSYGANDLATSGDLNLGFLGTDGAFHDGLLVHKSDLSVDLFGTLRVAQPTIGVGAIEVASPIAGVGLEATALDGVTWWLVSHDGGSFFIRGPADTLTAGLDRLEVKPDGEVLIGEALKVNWNPSYYVPQGALSVRSLDDDPERPAIVTFAGNDLGTNGAMNIVQWGGNGWKPSATFDAYCGPSSTLGGCATFPGKVVATGFQETSDARLKTKVHVLEDALEAVLSLRGVSFEWRDVARGIGRQIGFIAQELEKVIPELVWTDRDGYKSVAYANITALLVEALKQEDAKVQALEDRVADLEAQLEDVNALRAELAALRRAIRPQRHD